MDPLLVDIGNSQIKRAMLIRDKLSMVGSDPIADIDRVADEIANSQKPVALSCVVPAAAEKVKKALDKKQAKLLVEINERVNKPVFGFYSGMGADRISNIAGGWSEYSQRHPIAVIDLGSATTITTAAAHGEFAGGFVTLGLASMCKAIPETLSALPQIDPTKAENLDPAFDVYAALSRGTVSAHVGIIEKWIKIFCDELGDDLVVVITGGWSEFIFPFISSPVKTDPLLTLKGIHSIVGCQEIV